MRVTQIHTTGSGCCYMIYKTAKKELEVLVIDYNQAGSILLTTKWVCTEHPILPRTLFYNLK